MSRGNADLRPPPLHAERLLRVLAVHLVEFVIISGFALSAHGVIRAPVTASVKPDLTQNIGQNLHSLRIVSGMPARTSTACWPR